MTIRKATDILFSYFLTRVFYMYVINASSCAYQDSVAGKTPCCHDRLTTIICQRQKQQNPAAFLQKCLKNSDFAFVQCCRTCFDQKTDGAYFLNYQRTSELLLTNPTTAQCDDRRGKTWCRKFMQRDVSGTTANILKMDCGNVPLAFRLCRKYCGYCSSSEMPALAIYSYPMASDALRCRNPAKSVVTPQQLSLTSNSMLDNFYRRFSRFPAKKSVEQLRSQSSERSPNSRSNDCSSEIDESTEVTANTTRTTTTTHSPDDYFLVTDHNYDVYYDEESVEKNGHS